MARGKKEKVAEEGDREKSSGKEKGRGEERRVSSAEKRQRLDHATTYQAVNGTAMAGLFFTRVDFTTRDITLLLPLLPTPFICSLILQTPPPPSTLLAGCGLHPFLRSFYIAFSTRVRQRDGHVSRRVFNPRLFNYRFRASAYHNDR